MATILKKKKSGTKKVAVRKKKISSKKKEVREPEKRPGKPNRDDSDKENGKESVEGSHGFFNRRGFQRVKTSNRQEQSWTHQLRIRDGESVVVRPVETDPTEVDTHSIRTGAGPKDFARVVCPEMNPEHRNRCPVTDKQGRHNPSFTYLISVVDMRTLCSRENPRDPDKKIYQYDLSDYTYIPPVDSDEYDHLGEEPSAKYEWDRLPRMVKVFWMAGATAEKLRTFAKKLANICVNCRKQGKTGKIKVMASGERTCACGDTRPATIKDCYILITRHGADKTTSYDFQISDDFGFRNAPRDADGNRFKPYDLEQEIPIPTPEGVARMMRGSAKRREDGSEDED